MNRKDKFEKVKILKYLQDYRFNSILVKSFLLIFLVLLLSFTGIMVLVSGKLNRVVEKEVASMNQNELDKTQERMDTVIHEVMRISGQLSLDPDIRNFLMPDAIRLSSSGPMAAAREKVAMYASVFDYVDSIYVYSSMNRWIVTDEIGGKIDEFSDMTWFDNLTEREYEPARMIGRWKEDNYPYILSYIQPLHLTQTQFLGGIIVNIHADMLDEMVISGLEDGSENLLIVDRRKNIIFSSSQKYRMKKLDELDFYEKLNFSDGYQMVEMAGEEMVVSLTNSEIQDWNYISMVPMSAYQKYQSDLRRFYVLLLCVIVLISAAAAVIIAFYCYLPVKNILDLLKNPNIFEQSFETGLRRDESHEIGMNILRNLYSNRQMQEELGNYISIIEKAQVTALQAQISPHFLYNTLENIRWRAIEVCNGDNEVSQIILNLSQMLRISLDNERQIITLREEIRNAQLYTEILQLRYKDKMKVCWEIEEITYELPIVKVSLQPVIENAVYHGIKPMRGAGEIRISAQRLAEEVQIRVVDNGIGMEEEQVRILNQDMRDKYMLREDHIGIRNVNQRLKLLLGDEAGIELRSRKGMGTTVIIRIPLSGQDIGQRGGSR